MDAGVESVTSSEARDYLLKYATEASTWTGLAVLVAAYLIFVQGPRLDRIVLLLLALISTASLAAYARLMVGFVTTDTPRSMEVIVNFSMFFPWMLAAYFVLFLGLWPLRSLISEFSLLQVAKSLFWLATGYRLIDQINHMTNLMEAVSSGRIIVSEIAQDI